MPGQERRRRADLLAGIVEAGGHGAGAVEGGDGGLALGDTGGAGAQDDADAATPVTANGLGHRIGDLVQGRQQQAVVAAVVAGQMRRH